MFNKTSSHYLSYFQFNGHNHKGQYHDENDALASFAV